ncbi:MAG: phosphoribosylformylglycinamidine synthase subunit PurS [Candidatus Gastranaerophilales bacterium]|nr:phosphoribosylformylglycinamidine synthase subunit PurS [Candidatus Gastranaerophilales bacterium]
MKFLIDIKVTLKEGIKDPQGLAAEAVLKNTDIDKTAKIKVGKFFSLILDAKNRKQASEKAVRISEEVLTNPNLEVYEILKVIEA